MWTIIWRMSGRPLSLDGTIYGIPMQYNTQYLYWNKDIFAEAGLDPEAPPATFDEMVAYAEAMTDASKEQYGIGIATGNANITNFLWSNGGDWLNDGPDPGGMQFPGGYRSIEPCCRVSLKTDIPRWG